MARSIVVSKSDRRPIEQHDVEMVERKGIGHPDSLADGIAEQISRSLSKEYLNQFGAILHHNTDKVEIVGGRVDVTFGGGKFIQPIHVLLSGRATTEIDGKEFPVHDIGIKTAKQYLGSILPNADIENHVTYDSKIGYGSTDLVDLYGRGKTQTMPLANDTSFGVGFAPFSEVENLVMNTEMLLNSKKTKDRFPEIGQDIKVMGMRNEGKIVLTIAAAFVAKHVPDFDHYVNVKNDVHEFIMKEIVDKEATRPTTVDINTADSYDTKSVYLTLTGTSAEHGDDGCVGRGNRSNGLITPGRTMSLEAAAGKNPVSHIGKLYNILSTDIANAIHNETGVEEVYVRLLSQIGKPIDQPLVAAIEIVSDEPKYNSIKADAHRIADERISEITKLTQNILKDQIHVF